MSIKIKTVIEALIAPVARLGQTVDPLKFGNPDRNGKRPSM
ncbi:hypothetical protein [Paenibacillus sedimenti]|nr:hypothetical protein [Paenibacillus sedimenti]